MIKMFLCYMVVINIVAFVAYGVDKLNAKRGKWRIPETVLLLLAAIGGGLGAWCGIGCWHHMTLDKIFRYGVPLIILFQIAVCCYLLREYIQVYINQF